MNPIYTFIIRCVINIGRSSTVLFTRDTPHKILKNVTKNPERTEMTIRG